MRELSCRVDDYKVSVRKAELKTCSDAEECLDIYNHYILRSTATFRLEPQPESYMHNIYAKTKENDLPFLVAVKYSPPPTSSRMRIWTDHREVVKYSHVVGFAYALPHMAERPGWDATVDISLYLSDDVVDVGLGTELLKVSLDALATRKNEDGGQRIRKVLAAVALNPSEGKNQKDSAAFYRKQGFVECGTLKAVGRKFEKWIDVSIFQKSIVGRLEEMEGGSDDIESDESEEVEDEPSLGESIADELEKQQSRSADDTSEGGDEIHSDEDEESDESEEAEDEASFQKSFKGWKKRGRLDEETGDEGDEIYEVEDIKGKELKREKNRLEGYDP